jgi:hypothetical protein
MRTMTKGIRSSTRVMKCKWSSQMTNRTRCRMMRKLMTRKRVKNTKTRVKTKKR